MPNTLKRLFRKYLRKNRELANIATHTADVIIAGVNFSATVKEAHDVGDHSQSGILGLLSAFHAYVTVSLPTGKRIAHYVKQKSHSGNPPDELSRLMTPSQQAAYQKKRANMALVKQAYQKLHDYLRSQSLSARAVNALLLDIEAYRVALFYRYPHAAEQHNQLFADHVTALCRQSADIWHKLAPQAKQRAVNNLRFINHSLAALADQERTTLGIHFTLSQRDAYVEAFCEEHASLLPMLDENDVFEIELFAIKGRARQEYFNNRDQIRELQKNYSDFFAESASAYRKFGSDSDKSKYAIFAFCDARQSLLMYFELQRIRRSLNGISKHALDTGPTFNEIQRDLTFLADYDSALRKINQATALMQQFTSDFNATTFTTLGIKRKPTPASVLEYYTQQLARQESIAILGALNPHFIDNRIEEAQMIHFRTVVTTSEKVAQGPLLGLLTSPTIGLANGLQTYNNFSNLLWRLPFPGVTWFITICSGLFRAVRAKQQSEDAGLSIARLIDHNKGFGHMRMSHKLLHFVAICGAAGLTAVSAISGFTVINSILSSAMVGSIFFAPPIALILAATVAALSFASNLRSIHQTFDVIQKLFLKYIVYHHNKNSAENKPLATEYRASKHTWEKYLPVVAILLTFVMVGVAVYSGITPQALFLTTVLATVSLASLCGHARTAGRWLDHRNIKLFEAVGLTIDSFLGVVWPLAIIFGITVLSAPVMLPTLLVLASALVVGAGYRAYHQPQFAASAAITATAAVILVAVSVFFPASLVITVPIAAAAFTGVFITPLIADIKYKLLTEGSGLDLNFRQLGKSIDHVLRVVKHRINNFLSNSPSSALPAVDVSSHHATIAAAPMAPAIDASVAVLDPASSVKSSYVTIARNTGISPQRHQQMCFKAETEYTYKPLFHKLQPHESLQPKIARPTGVVPRTVCA